MLENQQTVESQLRAILDAYHPAPVRPFSSMDRQIPLAFVQDYPTPAIASRVRTARMQGFLTRHGYSGRTPAQTLALRMRDSLLSGSDGTIAGKAFSAATFAGLLELLNEQLSDYDDAIAATLVEHPDAPIFTSFPGVGPVLSAVLLSEIGEDRDRFSTPEILLRRSRTRAGHPSIRQGPQRPVPLRRQHQTLRGHHVVGLQLPEGLALGQRRLPSRP